MDLGKIIDIGGNDGSLTDLIDSHWDTRVLIDNNEVSLDKSKEKPNANRTTTAKINIIDKTNNCDADFDLRSDWFTRLSGDTSFLSRITHHIIKNGGDIELISKLCNMGKNIA